METILNIKQTIKSSFFIFILLCFLSLPTLSNAFDEVSADEEYIIELINEIRLDPLSYAQGLGFDRQALRDQLPWLDAASKNGFLPLKMDYSLFSRADNNNLFDDNSDSDAKIPPEYDYMITGETGGVVSFFNFMAPRDAIKLLLENLFANELDPNRTEPINICSSDYDLIGVSFRSGVFETTGQMAYFITLNFASSSLVKSQIQMLNVINQIRKEPTTLFKYLSLNALSDSMLTPFSEGYANLIGTYPPLFYQPILCESAMEYLHTPTSESEEELSPFDRAKDLGYEGVDVEESFLRSRYDRKDEVVPVDEIIEEVLIKELESSPVLMSILFSENMDEAGIGLRFIYREKTVVADFAIDMGQADFQEDKNPGIYGVIYSDDDKNGVYTPGEEIQGHKVSIYDNNGAFIQKLFTDYAGHFSVSLPADTYTIEVTNEVTNEVTKKSGYLKRISHRMFEDTFLSIDISNINQ